MYLVTGGAGFIGSNISETLLKRGEKVRILDNFVTGKKENISFLKDSYPKQLEIIEGSIGDKDICMKALKGIKYISHQAAIPSVPRSVEHPIETNEANITGTLVFFQTARNFDSIEKITFAASSSAYGDVDAPKKVETLPFNPQSPYAAQKIMGEFYCKLFWDLYKLPTVAFRYFNIFGPRQDPTSQYSAVIPLFIKAFINDTPPTIHGTGEQSRDFTHIDNVIEAHLKAFASDSKANGETINIACGEQASLNALIKSLQKIFNKDMKPNHDSPRAGDVMHSLADVSKAERLIGYKPIVKFEEGLEKTVKWYIDNLK